MSAAYRPFKQHHWNRAQLNPVQVQPGVLLTSGSGGEQGHSNLEKQARIASPKQLSASAYVCK